MIETSQEFINKMRAEQTVSARINIVSYKATTFKNASNGVNQHLEDIGIITDENYIENNYEVYKMPQLKNLRFNETGKYAVFEGEGIDLSGTQVISINNNNNQFGWWSYFLSDNYGYINPDVPNMPAVLEWYTKEIGQKKLNIVFSKVRNEYAVNFDVILTYLEQNEITTRNIILNVTDNNKTIYTIDNLPNSSLFFNNSLTITIKIYKWSKANARPKICQLSFGDFLEYTDDKITNIDVAKGISLTNENTESKDLQLTIQDENEEYNIFDPQGDLVNLSSGSSLSLELGCVIDNFIYYVKVDEFNLSKPKKEQNSLEVSMSGKGLINRLADADFTANYYEKYSVQQILDAIFGYEEEIVLKVDNTILNENTQIRSEYGTIKIPEALNKIATAVRGNVLETINNEISITRIQEKNSVATIKLENMITTPEIEKENKPNSIIVNIYTPTSKGVQNIFDQQINLRADSQNIFKYNADHTSFPYVATRTFESEGEEFSVEIEGVTFLENRAIWYPLTGGESNISITGNVIEITQSSNKYSFDNSTSEEKTIDTESIDNETQAKAVFDWLCTNYNKCFKYKVEVQDIFTYEIGDTVLIETGVYVNSVQIVRKAIITNIEYKYTGSLHYYLTLKGA